MSVPPTPVPPPPSRTLLQRAPDLLLWGGVFVLLAIAFGPAEIRKIPLLFSNSANMQEMGRGFTQPDFTDWRLYVSQMWLTVQIAIWGTTIAVLMASGHRLMAPGSVFDSAATITATIAAELGEAAVDSDHYQVLFVLGLLLFLITLVINLIADRIVRGGRAG